MNMCFKGKEIDQLSAMTNIKQNNHSTKTITKLGGGTSEKTSISNDQDHNEYCYTKDAACSNTTAFISCLTSNRSDNCFPDSKSF